MKAKIHPNYQECEIRCACGNIIKTRSTQKEIAITICSACHPFFTGKQKFVDTAGRIEKFQRRFKVAEGTGSEAVVRTAPKRKKQSKLERKAEVVDPVKKLAAKVKKQVAEKAKNKGKEKKADA